MTGWNNRIMALGENECWMTVTNAGKVDWSNMEQNYPGFTTTWNKGSSKYGYVSQIVLGSNGNYFIKGQKTGEWMLDNTISTHVNMRGNYWDVEVCALGRCGAYIVQLKTGASFWNLKGCYGGLQDWITTKSKTEKKNIRVRQSSYSLSYKRSSADTPPHIGCGSEFNKRRFHDSL